VLTDRPLLAKLMRSFRDWGKDCWCKPGEDDTCGKRFAGEYDHKYTFSHIGYNLKMSDLHAAIGIAQMGKLSGFVLARQLNHAYLWRELNNLGGMHEYFIFPPQDAGISWFGFCLICKPPIKRNDITKYLEAQGVQTRIIFAGNVLKQTAYADTVLRADFPLPDTGRVHTDAFWVGCWPGLKIEQLNHIVATIEEYVK
jgi:CDP-6-deoxy-D-xylo-4-hexulose-3-dehydrase